MNFSTDIKFLKGVGSVRAEAFYKLSVGTVGALLRYYPRTYEDWSKFLGAKAHKMGIVAKLTVSERLRSMKPAVLRRSFVTLRLR